MLLANGQALLCGHTVDAALDIEDGIDPPHRLDGERRTGKLRQGEELAAAMRPAGCLGHRTRPACCRVKIVEPGISVGLQDPGVIRQVSVGMLGRAVA